MSLLTREVVAAVIAVREAKPRIFIGGATFFSHNDEYVYIEIGDDKLCSDCRFNLTRGPKYYGDEIRLIFPYLDIHDVNTIAVNEHPNCRCILARVRTIIT